MDRTQRDQFGLRYAGYFSSKYESVNSSVRLHYIAPSSSPALLDRQDKWIFHVFVWWRTVTEREIHGSNVSCGGFMSWDLGFE